MLSAIKFNERLNLIKKELIKDFLKQGLTLEESYKKAAEKLFLITNNKIEQKS